MQMQQLAITSIGVSMLGIFAWVPQTSAAPLVGVSVSGQVAPLNVPCSGNPVFTATAPGGPLEADLVTQAVKAGCQSGSPISAHAYADFGTLGVKASFVGGLGAVMNAAANAGFTETFTVQPIVASGAGTTDGFDVYLAIAGGGSVLTDLPAELNGGSWGVQVTQIPSGLAAEQILFTKSIPVAGASYSAQIVAGPGAPDFVVRVPYVYGQPFDLRVNLGVIVATNNDHDTGNFVTEASLDFSHTLSIDRIVLPSGAAALIAESGAAYSVTAVPVPPAWGLLMSAVGAMGALSVRRFGAHRMLDVTGM